MPGSSVSACHLCHLHSHNHENLVRTSPLRQSRGKSKHHKYSSGSSGGHRHHHGHSNGGYNLRDDGIERVSRSNSASALARLTDHSHSLPGSRSNSLSRYPREVSILPDGGDAYMGGGLRPSASTRSLNLNPPLTSLLDARTTSLPRVSTSLHSHPQILPQPDILVNTKPRSRANSRSGSLPRNPVALSQDNSHDYYLDMHRQRFKEEKRKHRFNLQTVMLIGCYTLLVMIAIVVGVVLCYQNGWFGLGPPQEISGDRTSSNAVGRDSMDVNNRRIPPDKSGFAGGEIRDDPRTTTRGGMGSDNPSLKNNKFIHSAGLLPTSVQSQNPDDKMSNQGNLPRQVRPQNSDQNRPQGTPPRESSVSRNTDGRTHSDNRGQVNPQLQNIKHMNIPIQRNIHNERQGNIPQPNIPRDSVGNPSSPPLIPQDPRINQGILRNQQPSEGILRNQQPGGQPGRVQVSTQSGHQPINLAPGLAHQPNNQHPSHAHQPNSQHTKHVHQPSSFVPSLTHNPTNPGQGQHPGINRPNINPNLPAGVPLPNTNPDLIFNHGFKGHHNPNQNTPQGQGSVGNTPALRLGNIDANTIAKTLFQGNLQNPRGQIISSLPNTNKPVSIPTKNVNSNIADQTTSSLADKIVTGNTGSFTTQELLDLLAIRRMRDLLNSEGNTKTILELLRKVEPSANTRLEGIKEEKLNPSDLRGGLEDNGEASRGSGRNIQGSISAHPNNFKIRELIEALGGHQELSQKEISATDGFQHGNLNPKADNEAHQSTLKHLINRTINGALIRLINSRVDELRKGNIDPNLNFNVSGISVFPVNSEDLKILLESNPKNVGESLGNVSRERLRSLQILQRLIEINNRKKTVERHVDSGNPASQNTQGRESFLGESTRKSDTQDIGTNPPSARGPPSPAARISDEPIQSGTNAVNKPREDVHPSNPSRILVRNVTATFNRGETAIRNVQAKQTSSRANPTSSRGRPMSRNPDPSFAVMVRTDGLGNAPRGNEPVFPPPFISSRKRSSRARTRSIKSRPPIKESVAVQPGAGRVRTQSAVIRAWTHMDSKGTLSKGRVHRDGSFTFTNCRPIEVCKQNNTSVGEVVPKN